MYSDEKINLIKCGEVLLNLKKKHKKNRTYTFHCAFCETTWDQMKKFSLHLEELHLPKFVEESSTSEVICEPEIKIEDIIENENSDIENKILTPDIVKDDPLYSDKFANRTPINQELFVVEVKLENDKCDDNIEDKIKIEKDLEGYCTDDNDKVFKTSREDDSSSDEMFDDSNDFDFEIKEEQQRNLKKTLRRKTKKSPISIKVHELGPEEKSLNISLLQEYKERTYLWDAKEKCKNKAVYQKGFKIIASEVNDKLGTNITWDFAKNRINAMRFECSKEIEKQNNGEVYELPWYYDHIKYLQEDLNILIKARKRKRFRKMNHLHLPVIIELYKKYEDLWQVNSIYFGITAKREKILKNMLEDLKLNNNLGITLEELRNYIKYINRLYSKDKGLQLKCELEKCNFTPASNFFNELSFLSECQGPFKCSNCGEIIQKYESYHKHVAQHTNTKPFKCLLCEEKFKQLKTYISHVKRHLSENTHRCDVCGKGYPMKSELDRHLKKHTGEKQYLCQICGAGFRFSRDYDNHIRRHEKRFRYECHICKQGFNHLNVLNDHVKSHLNVRDIFCNICGKGFTANRYLNNHKLIHEAKKHYKCHVCGKEFAQGAGLRGHRRLHKPRLVADEVNI